MGPTRTDVTSDAKSSQSNKNDGPSNAEPAKPRAPPPRPGQQQQQQNGSNSPDYFSQQPGGGSLSLEPNPFEQSFGGEGQPETPGGTKLPSVHTLTSPSSLLPGSNATPFNWGGGSLRTGPLSPAMLSGPANDYFGDTQHLRGGFPTPNESSLRSGLTPGGSGSMFPAPSPNAQAFISQLASGGATPNTIDFHRTAMSAAAKRELANGNPSAATNGNATSNSQQQPQPPQQDQQPAAPQQPPQQSVTSQPQDMPSGTAPVKSESKAFDPHDNDAANGLFMLAQGAQGRNGAAAPPTNQFTPAASAASVAQAQAAGADHAAAARGGSENSIGSDESEQPKQTVRGKGAKKNAPASATANANAATVNGNRRKAEDPAPSKAPPGKKTKGNNNSVSNISFNDSMSAEPSDDEDRMKTDEHGNKTKMTDEEKRKNFLERNRYVTAHSLSTCPAHDPIIVPPIPPSTYIRRPSDFILT